MLAGLANFQKLSDEQQDEDLLPSFPQEVNEEVQEVSWASSGSSGLDLSSSEAAVGRMRNRKAAPSLDQVTSR